MPQGPARRSARVWEQPVTDASQLLLPNVRRRIAVANAFTIYKEGDCGLVKWCYNAMRLVSMPWLTGQAEVVVWTNARGQDFVRAECGHRVQRIVEFDGSLSDTVRQWGVATKGVWKACGLRCHLGIRSINDVALLKWQLVRHEEYQLIFLTDTDVDIFDGHYVKSEQEYLMWTRQSWAAGLDALLGSSQVRQAKGRTRYANGTQLVANPDFESPINAGVMLFKPSAATYRRGVDALTSMQWNLTHGFELAGSSCAGLPQKTMMNFKSNGLRKCSWNFLGANTDQGLFWYVFGILQHSVVRSRLKEYYVKHFWAYFKPWRQTSDFWCRRWYAFLDDASAFGTGAQCSNTRCIRQLSTMRARVMALNGSDKRNKCRGLWAKVF